MLENSHHLGLTNIRGVNKKYMIKFDISIILVVKNGAETLKLALDALLLQKEIKFEVILVDGGSSDESVHIFHHFNYANKKYINNTNELNVVDSIRKGFHSSSGALILTIGHDDILYDSMWLYKCKKILDSNLNVALISGRSLSIDSNFQPYALNPPFKSVLFDGIYSHLGVVLTGRIPNDINAVIRREVFDCCFPFSDDNLTAITVAHHYFYINFFKNNFEYLFLPFIANKSIDMRINKNRRSVKYKSIEDKERLRVKIAIAKLLFLNIENYRYKISFLLIFKYFLFSLLNNSTKVVGRLLPLK